MQGQQIPTQLHVQLGHSATQAKKNGNMHSPLFNVPGPGAHAVTVS